jgi:DNA-directed RNA polymerase subunit RPC12/RpoP
MRCEKCGTQNPPGFTLCIFCKAELEEEVQEEDITYGYLVCSECKGYYELQEGESPEDYYECECGGKLIFHWYKEEFLE